MIDEIFAEGMLSELKAITKGNATLNAKMDKLEKLLLERRLDKIETRSSIRQLRERIEDLEATG